VEDEAPSVEDPGTWTENASTVSVSGFTVNVCASTVSGSTVNAPTVCACGPSASAPGSSGGFFTFIHLK